MQEILFKYLGYLGCMIWPSKSRYRSSNPDNLVVFNANVCVDGKKVWYGDIDVTKSINDLRALAKELKREVYVLNEMDGRFDHEDDPLINNYVIKLCPDGNCHVNSNDNNYSYDVDTLKRLHD